MPDHSETTRTADSTAEDQGCLRRVMAVPLVILHTIAAGCCYSALITRPSGPWDQDAYGAITLSCFLAIAVSATALLITVAPVSIRRAMGPWWLVPPLLFTAVAAVRWALGD
ncbi:hypothetical protein ACIOJD_21015 [Streptomyces sp. NPDC088116]|uniref:hypothetical protein n=1 Tax=Streptomyces sp. NPDC088116 TaxID=3365825 RepID=UPI0038269119